MADLVRLILYCIYCILPCALFSGLFSSWEVCCLCGSDWEKGTECNKPVINVHPIYPGIISMHPFKSVLRKPFAVCGHYATGWQSDTRQNFFLSVMEISLSETLIWPGFIMWPLIVHIGAIHHIKSNDSLYWLSDLCTWTFPAGTRFCLCFVRSFNEDNQSFLLSRLKSPSTAHACGQINKCQAHFPVNFNITVPRLY